MAHWPSTQGDADHDPDPVRQQTGGHGRRVGFPVLRRRVAEQRLHRCSLSHL
ncbi:hypothetical protein KTR9_5218 (plasmid) [Gordonia sp. KTR9]|nr:hypothetical protein KTR9_5218 [Gordonia sp. KTR9]